MRLIDADALGIGRCNPDAFPLQNRGYCAGWNGVIQLIEEAPTVDAVPVVHGRWIEKQEPIPWCEDDVDVFTVCSICSGTAIGESNYCPNCGARMDLEEVEA